MTDSNKLLAAVDLGSNGFHMVIIRKEADGLKKIATVSEKVQLGGGLDKNSRLSKNAQERGLECVSRFADRLEHISPNHIRVVATNTLRTATNGDEFIRAANTILPKPIEIISGREEARLIYLGVASTAPHTKQRFVIDIGGGSTELIIGLNKEPILTESAQMGAVSFAQQFFADGVISQQAFDKAIIAAKKLLAGHVVAYKKLGFDTVVGTSGTIKAVLRALVELDLQKEITPKAILALKDYLITLQHTENIALTAVKAHRKAIFPAGVAILIAIIQSFAIKKMSYCDAALKEGVIFDMLGRLSSEDTREKSVQGLMNKFYVDKKQAKRIQKTIHHLLNPNQNSLQFTKSDIDLLLWAASLHEMGRMIGHNDYHRHGAYMAQHAEIAGFSQADQLVLAQLIRHQDHTLTNKDYKNVHKIGGDKLIAMTLLFRLCVCLHRSRKELSHSALELIVHKTDQWQLQILDTLPEQLIAELHDETELFKRWGLLLTITKAEKQPKEQQTKEQPSKTPDDCAPS